MTDASVIIAGAALVVSAIGFFYRVGRDSKGDELLIKIAEALNK